MNKKQARKIALQIAVALIDQEIVNPTGVSSPEDGDDAAIYDPDDPDASKVYEQLEVILAELQSKRDRFAD